MKCQFEVTAKDGKLTIGTVEGDVPDGAFVVGWGLSGREENLIAMFSPGDGDTTLYAQARTWMGSEPSRRTDRRRSG